MSVLCGSGSALDGARHTRPQGEAGTAGYRRLVRRGLLVLQLPVAAPLVADRALPAKRAFHEPALIVRLAAGLNATAKRVIRAQHARLMARIDDPANWSRPSSPPRR